MRLGLDLSLQQQQRLIMTPELRQAIAVLQCPLLELEQFLQEQLLVNPALELSESEEPDAPEPEAPEPVTDELAALLEYLGENEPRQGPPRADANDAYAFEAFVAPDETLTEYLLSQVHLSPLTAEGRRIAEFLVGSIDDNGYLTLSVPEAAAALGASEDAVTEVLMVLQTFDPVGVAARHLRECLLLQWQAHGGGNPLVPLLIDAHLDDLAEGRIARIAVALGVSAAEVQAAVDALRALDPKPGRRFGSGETRYVQPDAAVQRVGWEYVVVINDDPLPRLMVSPAYRAELAKGPACDPAVRQFVEERVKAAQWLINSIEHRRRTLYRIIESIVRLQRPFFDRGARFLRPLTLRQVADVVGVHESTVSRAVAGKYVQTPQGVFALRYFFDSGVESDSGAGVSAESVKRLRRDLVEAEDPAAPLSDQALTEVLNRQGVHISRRTVAKYREDARIPPSARRRRY